MEFKPDGVKDEAQLNTLLAETDYLAQVGRYVEAVRSILGVEPQAMLCWLNYNGVIKITDGRLELSSKRAAVA